MNARQKIIKERYFKRVNGDPLYYCPINDESIKLAPYTFIKILDIIINILEEEWDSDIIWGKNT